MERYGCDRPDLRYGLVLEDLTALFSASESGIIKGALAAGGRVRGIRVHGAAAWSRKQVDELEAIAKSAGAGGLIRLKSANGTLEGSLAKFLAADTASKLKLADGDLLLAVAAGDHISSPALDRVRQECAARLGLVSETDRRFLWVFDFPMFVLDHETQTLAAVHHPFTSPVPEDMAARPSAPETWRALAYDCVLNGTELGGGSIRTSDPAVQAKMFELLGIADTAEQDQRFGFLLEGLRAGAPPHGGIAFGFDRIAMILAGAESLRDVIAFPKTTAARALFEGAPSRVTQDDLAELHLRLKETQ
jgi:aspartyl-tRNA synthetase